MKILLSIFMVMLFCQSFTNADNKERLSISPVMNDSIPLLKIQKGIIAKPNAQRSDLKITGRNQTGRPLYIKEIQPPAKEKCTLSFTHPVYKSFKLGAYDVHHASLGYNDAYPETGELEISKNGFCHIMFDGQAGKQYLCTVKIGSKLPVTVGYSKYGAAYGGASIDFPSTKPGYTIREHKFLIEVAETGKMNVAMASKDDQEEFDFYSIKFEEL